MKEDNDFIDKLFTSAFDETDEASSKESWKKLDKKLFLSELKSFNLVNVNWKYWYYSGAALVALAILLLSLNPINPEIQTDNLITSTKTPSDSQVEAGSSGIENSSKIIADKTAENAFRLDDDLVTKNNTQTQAENQIYDHQKNVENNNSGMQLTESRSHLNIVHLKSRSYTGSLINSDKLFQTSTTHDNTFEKKNDPIQTFGQVQTANPSYYSLGLNLGSTWMFENNRQPEKINQPVLFAGINLRYNKHSFFVETSFDFSYFKSVYQSAYLYDTLLGEVIAPGYDIVEVINSSGDTVLERQFHSEIISVYDTLSSKDQVGIKSRTAVLSIPIHLGTNLYQRGHFYTSIFTGVMLKILLVENQTFPQFGSDYTKIIGFEISPTKNLMPEFYIQGGVMFGYQVLNRVNLELKSTYSHLLGENSTSLQTSKSNIQINFGINYRF